MARRDWSRAQSFDGIDDVGSIAPVSLDMPPESNLPAVQYCMHITVNPNATNATSLRSALDYATQSRRAPQYASIVPKHPVGHSLGCESRLRD